MGSDKARKRRARQLEAQFEKKSMRRAHFALSGGVNKQGPRVEEPIHRKDDGMTNALRKMLSMKEGKKKNRQQGPRSGKYKNDERLPTPKEVNKESVNGGVSQNLKEDSSANSDDAQKLKADEENTKKKPSISKQKRRAFMKNKGKKSKDDFDEPRRIDPPAFGEQAERPMEATLKRRHWVDAEIPKPLTLSMKNVGSRIDSKALAALYRTSRRSKGGDKKNQVATMETLKQLVKSSTVDSSH